MLRRCRPLLGTFVEVTADHDGAIEAAFDAINRVHSLMSAHEPESDISRINRFAHSEAVQVDEWTALVLERSLFWSKHSEGAFDILRAGKSAVGSGLLPLHEDQPVPEAAHWTWLELQTPFVRLLRPACIDVGGVAKGFAVDRALEAIRHAGARSGLVNAGGDMAGFGGPWPVQVVEPHARRPISEVILRDEALATSASIDGASSHLPDADTSFISATVRARLAVDADVLTKVVLSGSPVANYCLDLVEADAFCITASGAIERVACVAA